MCINIASIKISDSLCEQLFQSILVHDDIYEDAALPAEIHLDYSPQQLAACYAISKRVWYLGAKPQAISAIAEEIAHSRSLTDTAKRDFKYIRARFKHLRFAYYSCNERHHYPPLFHLMTKLMGSIQDALTNQHYATLTQYLFALKLFLSQFGYNLIRREIEHFHACSTDSFKAYVFKEMDFLKRYLTKSDITSQEFHEMRKVISRLVAHYDNLKILYPSDYHEQMSKFLSTINGMMGSAHDDLVALKLKEKKAYYNDAIEMDEPIRWRLESLVQRCENLRHQD